METNAQLLGNCVVSF